MTRDSTETRDAEASPSPAVYERLQLLVVLESSSQVVRLPMGAFTIGRAPEADLVVDDPSISRIHARLLVTGSSVVLSDANSRNGTLLNGAKVVEPRPIVPGDVIALGKATLLLQGQRVRGDEAVVPLQRLREQLVDELQRCTHYDRPLAVMALASPEPFTATRLADLKSRLRAHDRAALDSPGLLLMVLPELSEDEAVQLARDLLAEAQELRAGVSLFPEDGADGEALFLAAREAAATRGVHLARELVLRVPLGSEEMIIADASMRGLYRLVERLANADLPVLVEGETGTGKELIALALHARSRKAKGPFIPVNCAALPESLAESELFGYERGAFSGATSAKAGFFEAASGGTIFLDEIAELPLSLQAKLLRAAETHQIVRLGDARSLPVDVRIVAATHRDLAAEVKAGRFREDLYFRLCAARVALPALRNRVREIPLLARSFLEKACAQAGVPCPALGPSAVAQLCAYRWPGNVRELRNVMRSIAALHEGPIVEEVALGRESTPAADDSAGETKPRSPPRQQGFATSIADEIKALERARMAEALAASGGVQKQAAQLIGMPLRTFVLKLRQYGLRG